MDNKIKVGDTVLHQLSNLYFKCENKKHERWMNMNTYYIPIPNGFVAESYFYKNK